MAESLRVRCPFCGYLANVEQLAKNIQEKPATVALFLQKFGGKVPAANNPDEIPVSKGKGKAKGYFEVTEITDQAPDQVKVFEKVFEDRAKTFLASQEAKG